MADANVLNDDDAISQPLDYASGNHIVLQVARNPNDIGESPALHNLRRIANNVANVNNVPSSRTKFKTITDDNINTDELTNTDSENNTSVMNYPVHEFSLSTLNRKLRSIKKAKKKSQARHSSIDEDTPLSKNTFSGATIAINPIKLINENISEIQLRIIGHTTAAASYERLDKIIGYPITILSSFTASTIMMSLSNDPKKDKQIIEIASLIMSVTSFFLSISRNYLNYAKRSQSHDLSSKLYTTILRSVEVRLINTMLESNEYRNIFKDIVDQMSIIEQYEIPVPHNIDKQVRINNETLLNGFVEERK